MFFLDREGFPVETSSLAPQRGSERIYMRYQTHDVRSYAGNGRLQSAVSKTLV
jgi:hypothetical protein